MPCFSKVDLVQDPVSVSQLMKLWNGQSENIIPQRKELPKLDSQQIKINMLKSFLKKIECLILIPFIDEILNNNKKEPEMFKGDVQSGKTNHIFALVLILRILYPKSIISIFISNFKCMRDQYKDRLTCFNEKIKEFSNSFDKELKLTLIDEFVKIQKKNIQKNVLCLQNVSQTTKFIAKLKKEKFKEKIFTIIDEVDVYSSQIGVSKFYKTFSLLKDKSDIIFGFTATPYDTLFVENEILRTNNIHVIPHPEGYCGFNETTFIKVPDYTPNDGNEDETFLSILDSMNKKTDYPEHLLVKVSQYKEDHDTYYEMVKLCNLSKHWACIKFNGNGISVISKNFNSKMVFCGDTIKGKKVKTGKTTQYEYKLQQGQYCSLLTFLVENNITRIITIAGRFADRGYSFVDSKFNYHLTRMYYISSKTATCTGHLQSMRLFGIYKTKTPLIVYTTENTINDLRKYDKIITKTFDKFKNSNSTVGETMRSLCFKELPQKHLSSLYPKYKNLVKVQSKRNKNENGNGTIKKWISQWWNKSTISGKVLSFLYKAKNGSSHSELFAFLKNINSENPNAFIQELTNKSINKHYYVLYEVIGKKYFLKQAARDYIDEHNL
jgi:hypothetical protein